MAHNRKIMIGTSCRLRIPLLQFSYTPDQETVPLSSASGKRLPKARSSISKIRSGAAGMNITRVSFMLITDSPEQMLFSLFFDCSCELLLLFY